MNFKSLILLLKFISLIACSSANNFSRNSWHTSCQPCDDTLHECSTCLRDECVFCVVEIPYTGCINCINHIIDLDERFPCEEKYPYHNTVCKVHCRMKPGNILYRDGYCDRSTHICTCTTNPLSTTTHYLQGNRTTTSSQSTCTYKVNFEGGSQLVVFHENVTYASIFIKIEPSRSDCIFRNTIKVKIATKQYTAKEGLDYNRINTEIELSAAKPSHEIKIEINNDNLKEPFEFFTLEMLSVTPQEHAPSIVRKVIYIEDNDYDNGISTNIKDVFEYEKVKNHIYMRYKNKFDQFFYPPNPDSIFPKQGGITSPFDRLKILMQIVSAHTYNIHTIEVHNLDKCNLNTMNLRRLDYFERPFEDYFNSLLLNRRPVIDVNYFKAFHNLGNNGDVPDILDINFLSTKDGRVPTTCEIRAFGEEVY